MHSGTTDVWVVMDGANVRGAVVLVESPKSLTLATVAGNLSPVDLLHLRGHFGIPRFDGDGLAGRRPSSFARSSATRADVLRGGDSPARQFAERKCYSRAVAFLPELSIDAHRKLTLFLRHPGACGEAEPIARAKVVEDTSGSLKTLTSIGDALDAPDHHPVHILYVHGIDQIGAGDSSLLRESICTELKLCAVERLEERRRRVCRQGEFADGVKPPALEYLGSPVWNNADEWHAAAPFVVHWVVHLRGHPAVLVVDEINWWPLVLALKCRRVSLPEAYLAGPTAICCRFCSQPVRAGSGRNWALLSLDYAR